MLMANSNVNFCIKKRPMVYASVHPPKRAPENQSQYIYINLYNIASFLREVFIQLLLEIGLKNSFYLIQSMIV